MLLDRQGRFEARVEGPVSGNVLLRRAQYRAAEQPDDIVRGIASAKVANQRAVLMRSLRDYGEEFTPERRDAIEAATERLERILRRVAFVNEGADFGMIAGRFGSLIVVPPQVAIVGAGRVDERVVAHAGRPAVRRVLPLSLTFDHRVVTGGEAGRFLGALRHDLQRAT